jgi:hypothetical protein
MPIRISTTLPSTFPVRVPVLIPIVVVQRTIPSIIVVTPSSILYIDTIIIINVIVNDLPLVTIDPPHINLFFCHIQQLHWCGVGSR